MAFVNVLLVWAVTAPRHACLLAHRCYGLHVCLALCGDGKLPQRRMRAFETSLRPASFSLVLVAMNGSFIKCSGS